jgi:hypothetical protein
MAETTILLATSGTSHRDRACDAANTDKVDTAPFALKVKQELAAKAKARKAAQPITEKGKKAA